MIDFVFGELCEIRQAGCVVSAGGVGFYLAMSSLSISELPGIGQGVKVYARLAVRDDDMSLYGFIGIPERDMFDRLVSVSGIGPKVALAALSTYDPARLARLVAEGDSASISKIPGIGKKTAQRLILELRGSIEEVLSAQQDIASLPSAAFDAAVSALLSMGFSPDEAKLALEGYDGDNDSEAVRFALKRLGSA